MSYSLSLLKTERDFIELLTSIIGSSFIRWVCGALEGITGGPRETGGRVCGRRAGLMCGCRSQCNHAPL